jgi:hypothetical protein
MALAILYTHVKDILGNINTNRISLIHGHTPLVWVCTNASCLGYSEPYPRNVSIPSISNVNPGAVLSANQHAKANFRWTRKL